MDVLLVYRLLFGTVLGVLWFNVFLNYPFQLVSFFTMIIMYRLCRKYYVEFLPSEGKAVFITGCDTGFGYDLAITLAGKGMRVFAGVQYPNGKGPEKLKKTKNINVVKLDLTKQQDIDEAVVLVRDKTSSTGLWGVVNNAGIGIMGDVELCQLSQYKHIMDINLYGHISVIKGLLPLLRKTKGRIVNVSSIRGRFIWPGYTTYHISKTAMETMSDSQRLEMVKFGIHVSVVEPGLFPLATSVLSSDTCDVYKRDTDLQWERASDEVKRVYGKDYVYCGYDSLGTARFSKGSATDSTPVINVIIDALLSNHPKSRYLVDGGSRGYIDKRARLATCYSFLPTFISDPLVMWNSGYSKMKIKLQSCIRFKYYFNFVFKTDIDEQKKFINLINLTKKNDICRLIVSKLNLDILKIPKLSGIDASKLYENHV